MAHPLRHKLLEALEDVFMASSDELLERLGHALNEYESTFHRQRYVPLLRDIMETIHDAADPITED